MDVEAVHMREWLRVFIQDLGVVRDIETQHRSDGTVFLHMARGTFYFKVVTPCPKD